MVEQAEKPPMGGVHDIASRIHAARNPEPEQAPAPDVQESKPQEPEIQEPKAPAVEGADVDAPESEASETEAPDSEEDDVPTLSELSDLAEHLGVEVSDLYQIGIPVTTPDGVKQVVSLSEWKDGYQAAERLKVHQIQLEESRQKIERERQQYAQAFQQRLGEADAALQLAQSQVVGEWNEARMAELRATDPAEWVAQRQQFQDRLTRLERARADLRNKAVQEQQRQAAEWKARTDKHLEKERAVLAERLGWKDEAKARTERDKLASYMRDQGYTDEDLGRLDDHRIGVAFHKARLFDEIQAGAKAAAKKVKIAPKKVLKPGAKRDAGAGQIEHENSLRAKLKKSGRLEDAVNLLRARRQG